MNLFLLVANVINKLKYKNYFKFKQYIQNIKLKLL